MATSETPQYTDFTRDVLGRYICNGLDEAMNSTAEESNRADARDFDIIVIGGGTFGSAIAQQLYANDCAGNHRILVLEGGPFFVPEHNQNMSAGIGHKGDKLDNGEARSISSLRAQGHPDGEPFSEVWGLPWHSPIGFSGLSYSIGGRSVHWGGWSPRLLDEEMPTSASGTPHRWPTDVVNDLKNQYFDEAAEQIGVDVTNDFIHGPLHEAMRQRLADGIAAGDVDSAIPLSELPTTLKIPSGTSPAEAELLKLEAPLAVQSKSSRTGVFPINKFSTVPLIVKAVRAAYNDSKGDDVKKRLMLVPNCHVKRLGHQNGRITEVFTNQRDQPIRVPPGGKVIIALGTIESIRLALLSFNGMPNYANIGKNLMAHLRSNLQFRIPRKALEPQLSPSIKELQSSALFVKGRATRTDGSVIGHFHQQITASGLGFVDSNSEAELFKTIPDLDDLELFKTADDGSVVITVRGIGEMVPENSNSFVRLDNEPDENGERRAFVSIERDSSSVDEDLQNAMDKSAQDIVTVFANRKSVEPPPGPSNPSSVGGSFRHDGLGSTHHECGGLEIGDDPGTSVTNSDARFWHMENTYVVGPALFPTIGSPNPMLTGIAMSRRLADHLVPQPDPQVVELGFTSIFDGLTANRWRISKISNQPNNDPGKAIICDGALEMIPGSDIGLLWYTKPMPKNYVLKLEWRRFQHADNSGVFVRFPHPDSKGYNNTAHVGVDFGFEVQIDELGQPNGLPIQSTGAIYNEPGQTLTQQPARPAGEWNEFEIQVQGQTYTVFLNGTQVTTYTNTDPNRGLASTAAAPSFIGLQTHPGFRMAYRNIRFKPL
jgi:choline dehydrogenase-like flavoprotein